MYLKLGNCGLAPKESAMRKAGIVIGGCFISLCSFAGEALFSILPSCDRETGVSVLEQ